MPTLPEDRLLATVFPPSLDAGEETQKLTSSRRLEEALATAVRAFARPFREVFACQQGAGGARDKSGVCHALRGRCQAELWHGLRLSSCVTLPGVNSRAIGAFVWQAAHIGFDRDL